MRNILLPRIDRLATLYFFYPCIKNTALFSNFRIPILMYHSISENINNKVHPYYQTSTTPDVFADQMKYLYNNNYSVINLYDAIKILKTPTLQKDNKKKRYMKYAVITFDDGFRDFYTKAYPVLKGYNFNATVFLPTAFISDKRSKFKEIDCLCWKEVQELYSKGILFGSHTVTHPQLRYLTNVIIKDEILRSKETIESRIGGKVESFSYPFAFPEEDREFTIKLRDIIEGCGYKNGVSTRIGTSNKVKDKYLLKRIPVNSYDDIPLFKAKLEGGYNWLYKPQYIYKIMRNVIENFLIYK